MARPPDALETTRLHAWFIWGLFHNVSARHGSVAGVGETARGRRIGHATHTNATKAPNVLARTTIGKKEDFLHTAAVSQGGRL